MRMRSSNDWKSEDPMCDRASEPMFESLESRVLLSGSAFPELSDLVSQNNSVVRLCTNFGDVYFELYDTAGPSGAPAAPNTVDNFLSYLRRGDYDESFFHRLDFEGAQQTTPFVLQGGGFRFLDGVGVSNIPQQAQLANEFHPGRSNLERSIAMAKLGGQPNSATNQFFINLSDNEFLDSQNGGFTVFGRVANDASWAVVMDITDLERRAFNDLGGAFASVPVTDNFNPNVGPTEATLVTIEDVEVVKARNVSQYYTLQYYYPEGFAGSTINEFLPMGNNTGQTLHYQVIARAEVPQGTAQNGFTWFRDRVLDSGSIGPNARGGITISQFGENGAPGANDLVPQGVPYAIEVWATQSLAANISHYDFGTSTGEAFTQTTSTTWSFGEAEKVSGSVFDFLVWQNSNPEPANVEVTFYFQNQAPVTVNVTTDMYRRGGLSLSELPQIPNNSVFSIGMESSQPIVAALTHFDRRSATDALGSATIGVPGAPSQFGVLPLANAGAGVTDTIAVLNTSSTSAVVNLTLTFTNPADGDLQRSAAMIIPANSRQTFNLASIAQLADGRRYSIRFNSNAAVHAGWLHSQGFPGVDNRDAISNPISNTAATSWRFAEGFMDPGRAGTDVFETLSVYNPNSVFFTGENTTANVSFVFRYGDGHTVTETRQVEGGRRLDIDVHSLQSILNEGLNNNRFFYTVEIASDVPVVGQMWHFDLTLGALQPSGGFSTLGTASGTVVRLDALDNPGGNV